MYSIKKRCEITKLMYFVSIYELFRKDLDKGWGEIIN